MTRIHPFPVNLDKQRPDSNPPWMSMAWHLLVNKFPNEKPPDNTKGFECRVELASGAYLRGFVLGGHIFIDSGVGDRMWNTWHPESSGNTEPLVEPFFQAEVIGQAFTRTRWEIQRKKGGWYNALSVRDLESEVQVEDTYGVDYYHRSGFDWPSHEPIPFAWLKIRLTAQGADPVEADFPFYMPTTGKAVLGSLDSGTVTVTSDFYGLKRTWNESLLRLTTKPKKLRDSWGTEEYTSEPLDTLYRHLKGSILPDGKDAWWQRFFSLNPSVILGEDTDGLAGIMKRKGVAPAIARLQQDNPLDWNFLKFLMNSATHEKKKNNTLLSAFLVKMASDYDALLKSLQEARNEKAPATNTEWEFGWTSESNDRYGIGFRSRRAICETLPGAEDKIQEQEAKRDWTKRKGNGNQADGLGIYPNQYPLLRAAIEAGSIPTSVFHQPDKQPVNLEFAIWEKALAREGWAEVIYNLAQDAGARSTYEKDITPYLAFLFRIEKYLERHTGKKWKAMPRYVESQWELEMDDDAPGATTKRRSALTPVADNETNTVTVPYVAVRISGVRVQWCYAQYYHLFEEGMTDPISNGIVVRDLEEKLNGRDDYGLCFYTLNGTATAQGYPTFLIIFERLKVQVYHTMDKQKKSPKQITKTRVHFHRVRPQRVKDGINTPACKLIEACYQYMAGNVPVSDVLTQQGDLIFIPHMNDPVAAGAKVKEPKKGASLEFESHKFMIKDWENHPDRKITFYESEAKTPGNRLCFLLVPEGGMRVAHPEHEDIENVDPGWYEIRRCKSWEANPVSIWTLTID